MGTKKALIVREPKKVKYRDSSGNTWEAVEGQPNGTFKLPGSDRLFSIIAFAKWVERNVATAQIDDPSQKITDEGSVDFVTALALTGEAPPPKPAEKKTTSVKVKLTGEAARDAIDQKLNSVKKKMSKEEIKHLLGVGDVIFKRLVDEGKLKEDGKDGAKKLYSRK